MGQYLPSFLYDRKRLPTDLDHKCSVKILPIEIRFIIHFWARTHLRVKNNNPSLISLHAIHLIPPPLIEIMTEYAVEMNKYWDIALNVCLLGESAVGKTSLRRRYCEGKFEPPFSTIGVDVSFPTKNIDGWIVKLILWDTGGQERFSCIPDYYYRKRHVFFVVYDVTC